MSAGLLLRTMSLENGEHVGRIYEGSAKLVEVRGSIAFVTSHVESIYSAWAPPPALVALIARPRASDVGSSRERHQPQRLPGTAATLLAPGDVSASSPGDVAPAGASDGPSNAAAGDNRRSGRSPRSKEVRS